MWSTGKPGPRAGGKRKPAHLAEVSDSGHREASKALKWIDFIGEASSGVAVGPVNACNLQLRIRGHWSDNPPWAGPEGVDSEESEGPLRLVRLVGSVGPPGLASLGGRKQLQVSDHRMKLGNEMATSWPVGRKHSWGILSWVKPQRQPLAYP